MRDDLIPHFPHYPDLTLPPDMYPALTREGLLTAWQDIYAPEREVIPTDGVLGVVQMPQAPVKNIISVDLCEVVRRTHESVAAALGRGPDTIASDVWNYRLGIPVDKAPYFVTVVMNLGEITPDPEIDTIKDELLAIRKDAGTIIVANTSTLPGCEKVTLEFLARHLPDCFDGIVFPRNYDGLGKTTKGQALEALCKTLGIKKEALDQLIHIDDAPHHTKDVLGALSSLACRGACIVPVFEAGQNAVNDPHALPIPQEALHATSPLQSIKTARELLGRE